MCLFVKNIVNDKWDNDKKVYQYIFSHSFMHGGKNKNIFS